MLDSPSHNLDKKINLCSHRKKYFPIAEDDEVKKMSFKNNHCVAFSLFFLRPQNFWQIFAKKYFCDV